MTAADRPDDPRQAELAANLADVQARIGAACKRAGRDVHAVTLVAVTKTWPPEDVRRLAALGIRDVGENRDQEAATKAAGLRDLGLTWHFVGQLQANKAASVARYADVVQSVDRLRLVQVLDRGAHTAGRRLGVLVQVSLDEAEGRAGAAPADVPGLADALAISECLDLRGVMAVAPLGGDATAAFERLAGVHEQLLRSHPRATWRSAGMSGDLEAAIGTGATHLRIGTALLGRRPSLG
jgi:pyridoxal phosphate enzyme (YggS family)